MILKESWYDAIALRTSRRTYLKQGLVSEKTERIKELIEEINRESGLNFQFIENGDLLLSSFKASYGLISGKPSLIALAGSTDDSELKQKVGYYGQFLVLECVSLGLGTCWISGTYDRKQCLESISLQDGEDLVCVIAAGNVSNNKNIKELLVSRLNGGKQTFDELLKEKNGLIPQWVISGIESARLSPSAVNGKPVGYRLNDNNLTAYITKKNHGVEEIDLGISMAQFELGALHERQQGSWVRQEDGYLFELR